MAAVTAVCSALAALPAPAAAQHVHHPAPLVLDSLLVRAERVPVQFRSGSIIVNVRDSPAAAGSIADLLRTVPGLDLDASGRIAMRGSTSVLVLVNGRRMPLSGDALTAFLRQMPASALERIEAGTTASARQDANGGAGVVNLVFEDDAARRTASRSLAGSMATDDHYMGSAAATGRLADMLSWDAMYSLSAMRPRTALQTERWSQVTGDLPLHTDQHSTAREKHRLHSVMAGASVTPTARTSLALRGTYSWMEGDYRNRSTFVYSNTAGNTGASATGSRLEHVIPSAELAIVGKAERGRVHIMSEARTGFVNQDFRGDYTDEAGGYSYMTKAMSNRQREHVIRNDVGLRFSGVGLDLGHESQLRTVTSAHDGTHFGTTESQSFRLETAVHAGYATVHRSTGSMRAEAGLRVETDRTAIRGEDQSTRTAVRVFPSVEAEWRDLTGVFIYRLAYGRRINRPGPEMLNPFAMGEDDMTETIGNPSLSPEVTDQLELGLERHGSRATLQLTPFIRWTRDPIRPIKSATANGGAITALENLSSARATGADGSVRIRSTGNAAITLSGGVAHMQTRGTAFSRSGVHGTVRVTADLMLAEGTTAQIHAYRRSTQIIEQGEVRPGFTSEVALTQRLAGERGRLTLRVNDPLRTERVEYRIAGSTFTQASRLRTARPLLSLFASYAVGGAPREDVAAETPDRVRVY